MRINPINHKYNNQPSFQAVNQNYLKMAEKEAKGVQRFDEIIFNIKMDVCWKNMHPQDAIDTLEAIKKILPPSWKNIETDLEYVRKHFDSMTK